MKRVLVGIAVLCAGCAFDHGIAGDDDDGVGSDPDQDTDHDGVADRVDNCPTVANPDQRNHDGDVSGDSCDPCPHVVDTGADTDGDGVGDSCDPHPGESGDRIAYFEGFYGAVSWQPVIGANTWQAVDGTLRQNHTDGSYQLVRDDTALHDVFVDARLRVNALSPSTSARRSTGVVLAYGDPNQYFFCVLAAQPAGADLNAGETYLDFGTPQLGYNPAPFDTQMIGDWVTLQARVKQVTTALTHLTCVTRRGAASAVVSYDTDAAPLGNIGLRTNGVDASFDYIFVVEVPAGSP